MEAEKIGGNNMKRLSSFFVSIALVLTLAACVNPREEFDELVLKAEESLSLGDFELAKAYMEEATLILPDSQVAVEISSRIETEMQNEEVLARVSRLVKSESWTEAFGTLPELDSDAYRSQEAAELLKAAFELSMTRYLEAPTETELGESLLATIPFFSDAGITIDSDLSDSLYTNSVEQARLRLSDSLEAGPESGINQLIVEISKELYKAEDLSEIAQAITDAYETFVVAESKALVKSKDLSDAQDLLATAASKAPNSEAIKGERARLAELVRAEQAAIKKAEEEAKKRAVNAMYVMEDSFNDMKWFYDRATYSKYAGNEFLLYIGQASSGSPYLRMSFMLYRDNWHFFETIVVNVDGQKYEFSPGYREIDRDNAGGKVWESYDFNPSTSNLSMVRKIIDSRETRIRYINDDNVYVEKTVSAAQKRAFSNVLLAFEALGGRE
jgi:hypothetical protein